MPIGCLIFMTRVGATSSPGIFPLKLRVSISKGTKLGGTPYNGLYGEAPPERGTFFRLQVYKRVGISQVEVYKRVGKSVI